MPFKNETKRKWSVNDISFMFFLFFFVQKHKLVDENYEYSGQ